MSAILVYGPSGQGKSTAIKTLDPTSTIIICSDKKDLPFKGAKSNYKTIYNSAGKMDLTTSNYFETKKPSSILAILEAAKSRPEIKVIVLDTLTHIIISEYMRRALEKGFDKWNELAKDIYDILNKIQEMSDKHIIVIGHNDIAYDASGAKVDKVRSVGKLIDEKLDIPSLFTVVLMPEVLRDGDKAEYTFVTQSNGSNSAKSPDGMFPFKIPNDYKLVIELIDKYYNES